MRLGVSYPSDTDFSAVLAEVGTWDDLGASTVWLGESYGYDAVSALGALSARTEQIGLGFGVLPLQSRSDALIAMTAAGLDALSGGRAVLGLGVSGPAVVEGWHQRTFDPSPRRLRTAVESCRALWRGERVARPANDPAHAHPALKLINRPTDGSIPVHLAASGPGNVRLTAEVADGWLPVFLWPERLLEDWGVPLREGLGSRASSLGPLQVSTGVLVGLEDQAPAARAAHRRRLAHYIGAMGPRGANSYARLAAGYGFTSEVALIQQRRGEGDLEGAVRAVPDELVAVTSLAGDEATVVGRLEAYAAAGVTQLNVSFASPRPEIRREQFTRLNELLKDVPGSPLCDVPYII